MKNTNRAANGRRQFLRRLAALAVGLSIAGVNGCGSKEEDKKTLPDKPGRLPTKSKTK